MSFMSGIFRKLSFHQTDAPNISTIRNNEVINYYHEGLSMYVMDIPYNNANISLFTFLPAALSSGKWKIIENINRNDLLYLTQRMSTDEGMNNLRELLRNSRTLKFVIKEFTCSQNVCLSFEVEKNVPVRDLLKSLGVEELITSEMLELQTKCRKCLPLKINCPKVHINNVAHRSHIRATRDDVILGAVTLIHSGGDASPDGKIEDVKWCNIPFVWLIYDRLQEEILCVGSFNNSTCPNSQIVPIDIYQSGPSGVPPTKKQRLA
ncbi:uncharacterized protein LOC114931745 [Nylanderia fulva]|nr:uncharacterized protein LOC114931745 [Nylanderia fulva]